MTLLHLIKKYNLIRDDTEIILNVTIKSLDMSYVVKGNWFEDLILKHFKDTVESYMCYPADYKLNKKDRVVIFIVK